jgi:hypothetical protein
MVHGWSRTDEHMSAMYGHVDHMEIPWMGGRAIDMQKLLNRWGSVLDDMQEALSDIVKRGLLYRRMLNSEVLREDLANFRRAKAEGEGAKNYTHEFLRRSIDQYIVFGRRDKNLADRQQAFRQATFRESRCRPRGQYCCC